MVAIGVAPHSFVAERPFRLFQRRRWRHTQDLERARRALCHLSKCPPCSRPCGHHIGQCPPCSRPAGHAVRACTQQHAPATATFARPSEPAISASRPPQHSVRPQHPECSCAATAAQLTTRLLRPSHRWFIISLKRLKREFWTALQENLSAGGKPHWSRRRTPQFSNASRTTVPKPQQQVSQQQVSSRRIGDLVSSNGGMLCLIRRAERPLAPPRRIPVGRV